MLFQDHLCVSLGYAFPFCQRHIVKDNSNDLEPKFFIITLIPTFFLFKIWVAVILQMASTGAVLRFS